MKKKKDSIVGNSCIIRFPHNNYERENINKQIVEKQLICNYINDNIEMNQCKKKQFTVVCNEDFDVEIELSLKETNKNEVSLLQIF